MADHTLDHGDPAVRAFWRERLLCTVTFIKPDGRPHVVPMGVVLSDDGDTAWAITSKDSYKARLLNQPGPVAVCQVDGARWSTVQGIASIRPEDDSVAEAVRLYTSRYREPRPNPNRVGVRIAVEKIIGSMPSPGKERP